jgi:hypothetical protein
MEEVKEKITALGDKIKGLKSCAPPDKEAIGAAVQQLLDLKGQYAALNNGIGVDGKPFEDPKTKDKGAAAVQPVRMLLLLCSCVQSMYMYVKYKCTLLLSLTILPSPTLLRVQTRVL